MSDIPRGVLSKYCMHLNELLTQATMIEKRDPLLVAPLLLAGLVGVENYTE